MCLCLLLTGCALGQEHGYCRPHRSASDGKEPGFMDVNPIKSFFCWLGGAKQEAATLRSNAEYMIFDDTPSYRMPSQDASDGRRDVPTEVPETVSPIPGQ